MLEELAKHGQQGGGGDVFFSLLQFLYSGRLELQSSRQFSACQL